VKLGPESLLHCTHKDNINGSMEQVIGSSRLQIFVNMYTIRANRNATVYT